MRFSSWLNALKGSPRRPIRRRDRLTPKRTPPVGKLSFETLEARTVPAFLTPVDYPVGDYPLEVISAHLNADAVPDLALVNYYSSEVSVLLGNPDGTFQDPVEYSTGGNPHSLTTGDFNEDGALDLATANYAGLSVLLGNGNGTFQAASQVNAGSNPTSIAVGDFDDDGNLDLATSSNFWVIDYWGYYGYYGHYEGEAHVLLGNGDGTFAGPQTTALGVGYFAEAIAADFNEDGKDDLATLDGSSGAHVLLANPDGSGNLQGGTAYGTGWSPHSISVGDVNSDGIDDLVTANYYSISVLLGNGAAGNGDGTFQSSLDTSLSSYPSSVATGDFNDDGRLDLATSSNLWVIDYWGYYGYYGHYEGEAQVLLGHDNGHFSDAETTLLGWGWRGGIASADFDGDGFSDVAMTGSELDLVSVLINDQSWGDLPPPAASINNAAVDEGHSGSSDATFTVSLPFAHGSDVTVHYETASGTATAGSDFTAASGDVVIPAGETSVEIPIAVLGDREGESDETFTITISSADVAVADGQGVGTILEDERTVSIANASGTEETDTSSEVTFIVTLSGLYDQDVTVQYTTADGSATDGSDYTGVSNGSVTIPAGSTSAEVTIAVLDDRVGESDESFAVNLSGGTNALIVDGTANGTIADNEPRISINDLQIVEGNGKGKNKATTLFIFTVSLSEAYDQDVTVNFSTADGSATVAGNDYVATSGSLTIAAGETTGTITVQVRGDKAKESDEWFALNLTDSSTNAFLLDNQGIGWILSDDRRGRR